MKKQAFRAQVIVADCPWSFGDRLKMSDVKRGAQSNYSIMTTKDIQALPIKDLADPNGCLLALWCPSALIKDGLDIMSAWGFELKTTYVWVKNKKVLPKDLALDQSLSFGMGRTFRASHEIALIGVNDTDIYQQLENRSQRSVSFAPNLGHSVKPETLQNSLDLMFPKANKLELFARRERKGWTCLGNQCPTTIGEDISVSLANLA